MYRMNFRRILALWLMLALGTTVFADEEKPGDEKSSEAGKPPPGAKAGEKKDEPKPAPPEKEQKPKESKGSATIGGAEVKYVVKTGTMPLLKDDGTPRANVFYVHYAVSGDDGKRLAESNPAGRPITFCFNGGPGASAVWLHLGGIGPKRIDVPPDGRSPVAVTKVVNNPNSILDVTDLVFIDPVDTGLSRPVKGEKSEQFFGVDEDIEAVGEFIRLFTTREQRWASPKFLCGESYGVVRAAGLADYLQGRHGMYFSGLILVSGLLNFQTLDPAIGNDLPYILTLPTLTATAHFHKKLAPELQADFDKAVAESRAFARGDYAAALLKGRMLDDAARRRIAEKFARLTALPVERVLDAELRVSLSEFQKWLLRDEHKIIGRFDGRVISEDADALSNWPEFDPSLSNVIGALSAAGNAYIRGELGYESDQPYRVLVGLPWKYHRFENRYVSMESRLAEAMKGNPRMRVLVLQGLRDLAVPPDAMQFSLDHLPIPAGLRANIKSARFEGGHMMYFNKEDAEKLRTEIADFVRAASGP
jgi:carboxypeptidase C (cathepsin A)